MQQASGEARPDHLGTIGERTVSLGSDALGRVELERVGEEVDVQPAMAHEEMLDVAVPMEEAAIP